MDHYYKRIAKSQKLLEKHKVDLLLIEHATDIFYLTGLSMSFGKLLISKERALLLTDPRYLEEVKKKSPTEVALFKKESFEKELSSHVVGFDSSETSFSRYQELDTIDATLLAIENPIRELRMIKDDHEIEIMKRAAKITMDGYHYLTDHLKVGMTEKEVAILFEIYIREHGASSSSFDPNISFGINGAYPHHRPSDQKLKENEPVLMDMGVKVDGYCSDMTRVFFFKEIDPELKRIYDLVETAEKRALALIRPGVKLGVLDQEVHDFFKQEGVDEYFTHGLGHGVGLDIHEAPVVRATSKDKDLILEEGMVFTVEPGLYFPSKGGMRYEDTIVVTNSGYDNFY